MAGRENISANPWYISLYNSFWSYMFKNVFGFALQGLRSETRIAGAETCPEGGMFLEANIQRTFGRIPRTGISHPAKFHHFLVLFVTQVTTCHFSMNN